jgi:coatomer subunit beta
VQASSEYDLTEETEKPLGFDEEDKGKDKYNGEDTLPTIHQLTGYTVINHSIFKQKDPLYAEAFLQYHQYNIIMNVIAINRTNKTLQNVHLEVFSKGIIYYTILYFYKEELKLVEKASQVNIGPFEKKTMKIVFRASATEEGFIFGYLMYSSASGNVPHIIPLDHIRLTFLDIIHPTYINEQNFKKMWSEFIWENKLNFTSIAK